MNINKIPVAERTAIIDALKAPIKKFSFEKVRTVINNYFKNNTERQKRERQITELQKEIDRLKKKK